MEDIIQILIFGGAMILTVIVQNAKNKKTTSTESPQETLEDLFPEIEVQGDEMIASQPIQKPVQPRKRTIAKKSSDPLAKTPPMPETPPKQRKKISLSNREEAKRAFIHSEIFNRKY